MRNNPAHFEKTLRFNQALFAIENDTKTANTGSSFELTETLNLKVGERILVPISKEATIYPPLLQLPLALPVVRPLNSEQSKFQLTIRPENYAAGLEQLNISLHEKIQNLERISYAEQSMDLEPGTFGGLVMLIASRDSYGVHRLDPNVNIDEYLREIPKYGNAVNISFHRASQPVVDFMKEWDKRIQKNTSGSFRQKPYTVLVNMKEIAECFTEGGIYSEHLQNYLNEQQEFAAILPITMKNIGKLLESKSPQAIKLIMNSQFGRQLITKLPALTKLTPQTAIGSLVIDYVMRRAVEEAQKMMWESLSKNGVLIPRDITQSDKVSAWKESQGLLAKYIPELRFWSIPILVESELLSAVLQNPQALIRGKELNNIRNQISDNTNVDRQITIALSEVGNDILEGGSKFSGWLADHARKAAIRIKSIAQNGLDNLKRSNSDDE